MTPPPDNERDTQRIDDLQRSVHEINTLASRLEERVRAAEHDVRDIRVEFKEGNREVVGEVRRVGTECERKMVALDKKVDAEAKNRKEFEVKLEQRRERNEVTLPQKVALAAAIASPFLGAALTVATR